MDLERLQTLHGNWHPHRATTESGQSLQCESGSDNAEKGQIMALRRSKDLDDQDYVTAIGKGLDRAFKPRPRPRARRRSAEQHVSASVEASDLRLVVFSDLHRGTTDPADDFAARTGRTGPRSAGTSRTVTHCGCSATQRSCGRTG